MDEVGIKDLLATLAEEIRAQTTKMEVFAAKLGEVAAICSMVTVKPVTALAAGSPAPTTPMMSRVDIIDAVPSSGGCSSVAIATTERLVPELPGRCSKLVLAHDVGRIPEAAAPMCMRGVSAPSGSATPVLVCRLAAALELDKVTPTRCLMLGLGAATEAGAFDDKSSGTDSFDNKLDVALFRGLRLYMVPNLDATAHTVCLTKCPNIVVSGDYGVKVTLLREDLLLGCFSTSRVQALRPVPWPSFTDDIMGFQSRSSWPSFKVTSGSTYPTQAILNPIEWCYPFKQPPWPPPPKIGTIRFLYRCGFTGSRTELKPWPGDEKYQYSSGVHSRLLPLKFAENSLRDELRELFGDAARFDFQNCRCNHRAGKTLAPLKSQMRQLLVLKLPWLPLVQSSELNFLLSSPAPSFLRADHSDDGTIAPCRDSDCVGMSLCIITQQTYACGWAISLHVKGLHDVYVSRCLQFAYSAIAQGALLVLGQSPVRSVHPGNRCTSIGQLPCSELVCEWQTMGSRLVLYNASLILQRLLHDPGGGLWIQVWMEKGLELHVSDHLSQLLLFWFLEVLIAGSTRALQFPVLRVVLVSLSRDPGQAEVEHEYTARPYFTKILYSQAISRICHKQRMFQSLLVACSSGPRFLRFEKSHDVMGALLELNSWSFWQSYYSDSIEMHCRCNYTILMCALTVLHGLQLSRGAFLVDFFWPWVLVFAPAGVAYFPDIFAYSHILWLFDRISDIIGSLQLMTEASCHDTGGNNQADYVTTLPGSLGISCWAISFEQIHWQIAWSSQDLQWCSPVVNRLCEMSYSLLHVIRLMIYHVCRDGWGLDFDKVRTTWDPGGVLMHRLEGKPLLKKGGMSWACYALGRGPLLGGALGGETTGQGYIRLKMAKDLGHRRTDN